MNPVQNLHLVKNLHRRVEIVKNSPPAPHPRSTIIAHFFFYFNLTNLLHRSKNYISYYFPY
jgi:VanZ family protein